MRKIEWLETGHVNRPNWTVSVVAVMDGMDGQHMFYVLNQQGLYFQVFADLEGLLDYLMHGLWDEGKHCEFSSEDGVDQYLENVELN